MTLDQLASTSLLPGFDDPVRLSQQAFRAMLTAMARPGSIHTLSTPAALPHHWSTALTSLALTLFDRDTLVWLDSAAASAEAIGHLRFHCGCRIAPTPDKAAFAIIADPGAMPPLHTFPIGEPQYPDRSATLILAVESLTGGPSLRLTGPGIKGSAEAAPLGLPADFVAQWADNHALYPSGVDVFLTAGEQVMGLPRGVAIEEV